jgi:hypothetical protein
MIECESPRADADAPTGSQLMADATAATAAAGALGSAVGRSLARVNHASPKARQATATSSKGRRQVLLNGTSMAIGATLGLSPSSTGTSLGKRGGGGKRGGAASSIVAAAGGGSEGTRRVRLSNPLSSGVIRSGRHSTIPFFHTTAPRAMPCPYSRAISSSASSSLTLQVSRDVVACALERGTVPV